MRDKRDKLLAFVSITIDNAFVIRELKIIKGTKGIFVAMPSRKVTDKCPECGCKNHIRARFCSDCGRRIDEKNNDARSREKFHVDIAHPINSECRDLIQKEVMAAYEKEVGSLSDDEPESEVRDAEKEEDTADDIQPEEDREDDRDKQFVFDEQDDNEEKNDPDEGGEKKSKFGFGIFS